MEEIWNLMMTYDSMNWWDGYALPVPIRKWLIGRYNRYVEKEQAGKGEDPNKPLSNSERIKMIKQAQETSNPTNLRGFMGSRRNKK